MLEQETVMPRTIGMMEKANAAFHLKKASVCKRMFMTVTATPMHVFPSGSFCRLIKKKGCWLAGTCLKCGVEDGVSHVKTNAR